MQHPSKAGVINLLSFFSPFYLYMWLALWKEREEGREVIFRYPFQTPHQLSKEWITLSSGKPLTGHGFEPWPPTRHHSGSLNN